MLGVDDSLVAGVRDATADAEDGRFLATCGAGTLGSGDADEG
jgi:hypothetical protein